MISGQYVGLNMEILIDKWEKGRRVSQVEGRARAAAGQGEADEVEFTLTLYADQISLNIPATAQGLEFIALLTGVLGTPKMEPTVKCSCSWGDGVMGAMYLVLWEMIPEQAAQTLEDLHAFLTPSTG